MNTTAPTTIHTVRITCACDTCNHNAASIGKPAPLSAWITEGNAAKMGINATNSTVTKKTHGYVELANHPILGRTQRAAIAG